MMSPMDLELGGDEVSHIGTQVSHDTTVRSYGRRLVRFLSYLPKATETHADDFRRSSRVNENFFAVHHVEKNRRLHAEAASDFQDCERIRVPITWMLFVQRGAEDCLYMATELFRVLFHFVRWVFHF